MRYTRTVTFQMEYHTVFAPKYRRKMFYDEKRYEIGKKMYVSWPYPYAGTPKISVSGRMSEGEKQSFRHTK